MFRLIIPPSRAADSFSGYGLDFISTSVTSANPTYSSSIMPENTRCQAETSEVIRDHFSSFVGDCNTAAADVGIKKTNTNSLYRRGTRSRSLPHDQLKDNRMVAVYSKLSTKRKQTNDRPRVCCAASLDRLAQPRNKSDNIVSQKLLSIGTTRNKPNSTCQPRVWPNTSLQRKPRIHQQIPITEQRVTDRPDDFYLQATLLRAGSLQARYPATESWRPVSPHRTKIVSNIETDTRSSHTGYTASSLSDVLSFTKLSRRRIKLKAPLCA